MSYALKALGTTALALIIAGMQLRMAAGQTDSSNTASPPDGEVVDSRDQVQVRGLCSICHERCATHHGHANAICQHECRTVCVPECEFCKAACHSVTGARHRSCIETCEASDACVAPEHCGNGRVDAAGEQCDDGNLQDNDGCSSLCVLEFCGDALTQPPREQCDDGNDVNDDTCDNGCQPFIGACGNGRVEAAGEVCDDGNMISGDGCSATCNLEGACAGYEAPTTPAYPCGPTLEIGSPAELVALLPSQWPGDDGPVHVFPVSPNVRASADLTLTSADLPSAGDVYSECGYASWLCLDPWFSPEWRFPTGPDTLYTDTNGLHIRAGVVFRVSAFVFTKTYPPFFPVVLILRSCQEPCLSDETRCLVDQVCRGNWDYCLRCLGLDVECCACTDTTGAKDDGTPCSYGHSDIIYSGSCFGGYCN